MKKYIKISVLSIFSLMVHAAENPASGLKATKRTSTPRSLASSHGLPRPTIIEPSGENLSRSLPNIPRSAPVNVPIKEKNDFSPTIYFGYGILLEKKHSYTPGNDSGR